MRSDSEAFRVEGGFGMPANDVIVAGWLNGTDHNSPAGPLFIGGEYAESEIVTRTASYTATLCSFCTSTTVAGRYCC
jgi:hypothetical protein